MNKLSFLLLLVFSLFFTACEKDEAPEELSNILQYDNGPVTGPFLPFGTHTFAVRFTENELKDYIGKSLSEITFYAGEEPEETRIFVYGQGTASTPGEELYTARINGLAVQDWNDHRLVQPLEITGEDLWLAVQVVHITNQRSIGCDAGPNIPNGDWLFRADDPEWNSFSAVTPSESVNWNIRGKIE